jgi:hypothetical protein
LSGTSRAGCSTGRDERIRDFLRSNFVLSSEQCGTNFTVVRHSPDWSSFDPESSRALCVKLNLPETHMIDFMAFWNAAVAIDYRQFRFRIKKSRSRLSSASNTPR